ncbi:MAG TPA: BON domain-containing protein [Burkholderiaceae bacterium]|nr:BON domain-containing protein [Burkholderiaceae bacterium]
MGRSIVAASLLFWLAHSPSAEELKNWFDDPYFVVRSAVRACPVPRGPFISEADMRRSAHGRAERGTGCWLEGKCSKSNAYHYDAAIADEVRKRFAASRALAQSSLWVTVQRRIVWVEGCSADRRAGSEVERLLRGIPDVTQVRVNIASEASSRPPYPAMPD